MPSLVISPKVDEQANFAVLSRLLSCLVTESLLDAIYTPIESSLASGLLIVLSSLSMTALPYTDRTLYPADVFAIVPLRRPPVLHQSSGRKFGFMVSLVDPTDMLPEAFCFGRGDPNREKTPLHRLVLKHTSRSQWRGQEGVSLVRLSSAIDAWHNFAANLLIDDRLVDTIAGELLSSYNWQRLSYDNPPRCPDLLAASIEWEQSLVCGHPTHPMHRARRTLPPVTLQNDLQYNWHHPQILFASVPCEKICFTGDCGDSFENLARKAAERAGRPLAHYVPSDHCLIPVHELQVPKILQLFDDIKILPSDISVPSLAQSSIRTVLVPDMPDFSLKLPIAVKISSATRTISHFTATFGPRFSREIVPALTMDRRVLTVMCEPGSAVYRTEDENASKHFCAILRDEYKPLPNEHVIVCAALLETGHSNVQSGVSAVEHAFGLDTRAKRISFLQRYITLACEAVLPPLLYNGVSFEAHSQNMLLRFDERTKELKGFVMRDLGGLRIHPPTLHQSTGINFEFLPNHCVVTDTVEETYTKLYHTLVHNHLQRLIRVLDLHYDGVGWEMLRETMDRLIPADHSLRAAWLSPSSSAVSGKCLLRMSIEGVYRDSVYRPFPNMIQYRPLTL